MSEAEALALNSLDLESFDVYFSIKDEGKTVTYPFGQDINTQVKFINQPEKQNEPIRQIHGKNFAVEFAHVIIK